MKKALVVLIAYLLAGSISSAIDSHMNSQKHRCIIAAEIAFRGECK